MYSDVFLSLIFVSAKYLLHERQKKNIMKKILFSIYNYICTDYLFARNSSLVIIHFNPFSFVGILENVNVLAYIMYSDVFLPLTFVSTMLNIYYLTQAIL